MLVSPTGAMLVAYYCVACFNERPFQILVGFFSHVSIIDFTNTGLYFLSISRIDDEGIIWIATFWGGLNRFCRETGQFTRYQHCPDDLHSLSTNLVNSVYFTPLNVLLVGANDGLSRFDSETEQFIRFPEYFKGQPVHKIYESKAKVL